MEPENIRFLAMEYYLLILNRTYEITVTESGIYGAVVCQLMPAGGGHVFKAIKSGNAYDLVSERNVEATRKFIVGSAEYLSLSNANFSIKKCDVTSVVYDQTKKWGMGNVPHNGKLHIQIGNQKKIELILLGKTSANEIMNFLSSRGFPVVIT